jgi:hypothetical protein
MHRADAMENNDMHTPSIVRTLKSAVLLAAVGLVAAACAGAPVRTGSALDPGRSALPNPDDVTTYVAGPDNGAY